MLKILFTGGGGMLGKNFTEHSLADQYLILSPDRKSLDLLNLKSIDDYLASKKPDFIIHAAGLVGGIQHNIREPFRFFYENLQMGMNLIKSAKENEIKHLLNIGSSCMYPKNITGSIRETDLLTGSLEPTNEGYALAKIGVSKMCEYISNSDKKYKYKTIIPPNLYGKYDKFNSATSHLIPAIIDKIFNAKKNKINSVEIWGDGTARREFMYVKDAVDFIYFSLNNFNKLPQYLNLGLEEDHSITDYYLAVASLMNYEGEFQFNTDKPVGMKRKKNNIKLLNNLGWLPKYNLRDGLEETIQYYTQNYGL
jgi:GDP-L-fucose synthase